MTKISNQYSLTNILTADLANSRLGINNVSPTVALDVTGAGKFSGVVTLNSNEPLILNRANNTSTSNAIRFQTGGTTQWYVGSDYYLQSGTENFGFYNGSYKLTITAAGNVGIGTTTPTTKLEVSSTDLNNIFVTNPTTSGATTGSGIGFKAYNGTSVAQNAGIILTSNTWSFGTYSANQLSLGSDGTGGLALRTANSAPITFFTGGTTAGISAERMRIDSAGNVGIGTSSPKSYGALTINGQTIGLSNIAVDINQAFKFNNYYSSSAGSDKTISTGYAGQVGFNGSIGALTFSTSSSSVAADGNITTSEKMRLTSTGNLGLGTTTPDRDANTRSLAISGGLYNAASIELFGPSAYSGRNYIIFTGTGSSLIFYDLTSSATRMTISSTGGIGAAGSTTNIYNPSDKRLKQNISTLTYGLDKVKALNPVKFNWADGFEPNEANKTLLGFIAQEVNEVIPEAIESFGGDINLNGKVIDNPLRVNEKFIIPVLVKAIQELSAKVSLLENK